MDPRELDLGPVLRDAYLRKAAFGPRSQTVELTFHVLRRLVEAGEGRTTTFEAWGREPERIAGFRYLDVRAVASEAVRWDRDAAKWVPAKVDWLGSVARDAGPFTGPVEPGAVSDRPIVWSATLGVPGTIERWRKSADHALWLRGRPDDLLAGGAIPRAAVLFEMTAEVILPNGWNANGRLFIASADLAVYGARGPITLDDLVSACNEWTARWRAYWAERDIRPDLPEDPQLEWAGPPPPEEG